MHTRIENSPRWYQLVAFLAGGIAVGMALAVILWL
jgi:hypothetical protein